MSHDLVLAGGRVVDPETGFDRVCDVGIDGRLGHGGRRPSRRRDDRRRRRARRRPWLRRPPQPRADAAGTAAPGVRRGHHRARPRSRPCAGGDRVRERSEARFPDQLRLLGVVGGGAHARGRGRAARRERCGDLRRVGRHRVATALRRAAQVARILDQISTDLAAGAVGIGVLIGYTPGVDPAEYLAVAELAAAAGVPTFTHSRATSSSWLRRR